MPRGFHHHDDECGCGHDHHDEEHEHHHHDGECGCGDVYKRQLLGREHFHMKVATNDSRSGILSEFMKQYYGGTPYIPNVICLLYTSFE